jgi:hypothetical protein
MSRRRTRNFWVAGGIFALLSIGWLALSTADERPPDDDVQAELVSPARKTAGKAIPDSWTSSSQLPRPSAMPVAAFEERLFEFLNERRYQKLGWRIDKAVRDTGPYIDGKYYGTHPAVRIFYSPEAIAWLEEGRKGPLPDGTVIIKEQYPPPAVRHEGKSNEELWESLESWTVMVKDSQGSHDGWFWSNPAKGQCVVDNTKYPFDHPLSGFGLYCVRCHASAHSPGTEAGDVGNEYTFISGRNIEGFPGHPLLFRVDDSWREIVKQELAEAEKKAAGGQEEGQPATPAIVSHDSHPSCALRQSPQAKDRKPNQAFLQFYDAVQTVDEGNVAALPPVTLDWAVAQRGEPDSFMTSNQCMNCHAGLTEPFGPNMFIPTGEKAGYGDPGRHISPYGEWRWTPMGLAGRDPVFYAQLESECALLSQEFSDDPAHATTLCETLTETCLRCHGAMGKHQFDQDVQHGKETYSLDHVHAKASPHSPHGDGDAIYGALSRDGISCMVCHRMQPPEQPADDDRPYLQFFLEAASTGNVNFGKPGEIYGPFKDDEIAPYVMEHATGLKPKHSEFLKSSQLCGSCHTISLPVIDNPIKTRSEAQEQAELLAAQTVPAFRKFHHHVEQATYLEWLNSEFENEFDASNPKAKTCQDCHMSQGLVDDEAGLSLNTLETRIASIQDLTYPDAENLAPHEKLNVRLRTKGYARHNFAGLNVFLLEMFKQFDDVLGVRTTDYFTGSKDDLQHAINDMVRTARNDVADVSVAAEVVGPNELSARVLVENKVGHRFPTGVGFRRAFIELLVVQPSSGEGKPETIVWSSGRTNELGVLIGPDGQPLPTEFFDRDDRGEQRYQRHHEVISEQGQVQIYESLLCNAQKVMTTSFVHGCERIKDNRLLPRGWSEEGPDPEALSGEYLKATHPDPTAARDPQYADGSGSDEVAYRITLADGIDPRGVTVRATLYYQAMPPYFLKTIFDTSPDGPATRRLHYICSHINLKGTPIENWKLKVTSAEAKP